MAFGAAPGPRSKVWYTLADGSLSEVFFPTLDRVALHELRFFASAPGAPPVDDASDGQTVRGDLFFTGPDGRLLGVLEQLECTGSTALNRLAGHARV